MPVNHYFQGGNGIGSDAEKRLYENLIIEGLKIYGQDVYYLPRTLVNRDLILGEDVASKFNGVTMLGGVQLNGQQIYTEALADVEKLEQEIRTTYELNPGIMIG